MSIASFLCVKPQKGDLFVVSPKENMYFWGVIINSDVKVCEEDGFMVVFIFASHELYHLLTENHQINPDAINS